MTGAAVSCIMTVRGEAAERLRRRLGELEEAAEDGVLHELVVAAPPAECDHIRELVAPMRTLTVSVVANESGERSPGLNRALESSVGEFVLRVDARSSVRRAAVAQMSTELAAMPDAGVVGAHQIPIADDAAGLVAKGVARALANPLPLGNAAYRRSGTSGPADTVYLGVFRRSALLEVGGWDVTLRANEDFDLCRRLTAAGWRVWLAPVDLPYEPRTAIWDVWRQYREFGRAKVAYWERTAEGANRRQRLALIAPLLIVPMAVSLQRGSWRTRATLMLTALLGLVGLDVAHPRKAPIATRLASLAVYPAIWGGWVWGAATERCRATLGGSRGRVGSKTGGPRRR